MMRCGDVWLPPPKETNSFIKLIVVYLHFNYALLFMYFKRKTTCLFPPQYPCCWGLLFGALWRTLPHPEVTLSTRQLGKRIINPFLPPLVVVVVLLTWFLCRFWHLNSASWAAKARSEWSYKDFGMTFQDPLRLNEILPGSPPPTPRSSPCSPTVISCSLINSPGHSTAFISLDKYSWAPWVRQGKIAFLLLSVDGGLVQTYCTEWCLSTTWVICVFTVITHSNLPAKCNIRYYEHHPVLFTYLFIRNHQCAWYFYRTNSRRQASAPKNKQKVTS